MNENKVTLVAVPRNTQKGLCHGCMFEFTDCSAISDLPSCVASEREDGLSIVWKVQAQADSNPADLDDPLGR